MCSLSLSCHAAGVSVGEKTGENLLVRGNRSQRTPEPHARPVWSSFSLDNLHGLGCPWLGARRRSHGARDGRPFGEGAEGERSTPRGPPQTRRRPREAPSRLRRGGWSVGPQFPWRAGLSLRGCGAASRPGRRSGPRTLGLPRSPAAPPERAVPASTAAGREGAGGGRRAAGARHPDRAGLQPRAPRRGPRWEWLRGRRDFPFS